MSGEVLMKAISDMDDSFVNEFAEVKKYGRVYYLQKFKSVAMVASVVILFLVGTFIIAAPIVLPMFGGSKSHSPHRDVSEIAVWNTAQDDARLYLDKAEKGQIIMSDALINAVKDFSETEAREVVLAVRIVETSGASEIKLKDEILNNWKLSDAILYQNLIFVTKEELLKLTVSDDFSVILLFATKDE